MVAILRKKTASSVRFKPLKAKTSFNPFNRLVLIKPAIVLLCIIFSFTVYSNWQHWLESLDRTPIRAYALTHKTRFTTNSDIRETLSQTPALKGYFGQDIQ